MVQGHDWNNLRDVTGAEIRAQVNLVLAHGATGVYYFMVSSHTDTDGTGDLSGLLDDNYQITDKWRAVTALNMRLEALAPTYLALASNEVFEGTDPDDFVHGLSAATGGTTDYFLGTFTHTDGSRYLMIVNERCRPADTRAVTVTLDATDLSGTEHDYRVFDPYGRVRTATSRSSDNSDHRSFQVSLEPGEGKLYLIEPDRPGSVSLSSDQPRVDRPLTAVLHDADGEVQETVWTWDRGSEESGAAGAAETSDDMYTPTSEDIGRTLTAQVTYLDGASADADDRKSAQSAPVVDVPTAPENLQALPGDGEAFLTWQTPADHGSELTGYQYRQSTDGGGTWSPDWGPIPLPEGTVAADLEEHTVPGLTNGQEHTFEVRAVNGAGEGASGRASLEAPENLRANWVFDGAHALAHDKARLTWDDPGDARITGWDYQKKEGDSAWGTWQDASRNANTVTKVVDGLKLWRTYRFKVRARYATGTGPESAEAVLSPFRVYTDQPAVVPRSGDGKAQLDVGFDLPVEDPDRPEGSLRVLPGNFEMKVETVSAAGEVTESEWVSPADIRTILSEAELVEEPFPNLPPVEDGATGGAGAKDQSASRLVVASIRVSGLDPGVTYRFQVRLVRPDGVTGSESASRSVLGLRWQRRPARWS